jgi:hypothetical protein
MTGWAVPKRGFMGAVWGAGLGFLAAGMELTTLAAQQTLPSGFGGFVALGLVDLLLMGTATVVLGLVVAPLHLLFARARASTAIATHLTVTGFLLCGFYLWQAAWLIYTDQRAPAAYAMAAMPLGFTGMVYFNSRFLLRRHEAGRGYALPWLPTAFAAGLALIVLSGVFQAARDTGGPYALQDDRNVVIVTLDRADALPETVVEALPGAVVFTDAVTPSPHARPAAAALLTGLHPLRNRTLFDDSVLPWHYTTLAETLADEGYATGAFVSTPEVQADSGLQQGFKVYDDDFSPLVPGLLRLNLARHLLGTAGWERSAADTVDRFTGWLEGKVEHPFFAWLHLPAGGESAIPDVLAALEPVEDETLVVLTATRGTGTNDDRLLADERIGVPLVLRIPGLDVQKAVIPQQLRLMDVAVTATTWLAVEAPETEGLDLAGYPRNERTNTLGTSLLGRTADGVIQLGLRNNGVKFVTTLGTDDVLLFRLEDDPDERKNLAALQPDAVEQAQRLLAPDSIRLEKLLR